MRGNRKNDRKRIEHWQVVTLILLTYDFLAVVISYFAALWIRFDCRFGGIESKYLQGFFHTIVIYAAFCVVVFWFLRLYKSIWRCQRLFFDFFINNRLATFVNFAVRNNFSAIVDTFINNTFAA